MPQNINQFKGDKVVIGCTATHHLCTSKCHASDEFYSIDIDPRYNPDFIHDITKELSISFHKRFVLTYVENLDWFAYNTYRTDRLYEGANGFKTMWDITKDDGFIIIQGCPRIVEFRNSIKTLKYIEINGNNCVIIPKNQNLTIEDIRSKIQSQPRLFSFITSLTPRQPTRLNELTFCQEPFINFLRIMDELAPKRINTKKIPQVRALYFALEDLGQYPIYLHLLKRMNAFFDAEITGLIPFIPEFQKNISSVISHEQAKLTTPKEKELFTNFLRALEGLNYCVKMQKEPDKWNKNVSLFVGKKEGPAKPINKETATPSTNKHFI